MESLRSFSRLVRNLGLLLMLAISASIMGAGFQTAAPPPEVVDIIVHDKGNISTSIQNWGLIGDPYGYYISGEWPRNSGHDYIAEIKFWMGAVTPTGDTIVANTDDDFRPIPVLQLDEPYNILLSTDTTRYLSYDINDTVGLGLGNPAYGWRIYNPDSSDWTYNYIYSIKDSAFHPGGPIGLQQSFYRFDDGRSPFTLGLHCSQTMYQWNYCYNENIIFVVLEITNASGVDYTDFAFAIYCDFDVGGLNELGGNGRLHDLVDFDSTENLAWTYDDDFYDEGWASEAGIMGTKYLETPDDIGMTAFRTDQWENLPEDDAGRFVLINSQQYDISLPPTDQYYLQCTRGINLTAGKTVRVVFAIVAGEDEEDFYANAASAQTLYDNYFVGPQPPYPPTLQVKAGDGRVYLHWNDTSETDIDPLTGVQDFIGYKLYRSTNKGYTWGKEDYDSKNECLSLDYKPIAKYRVINPGDPIQHSFIDSNLINGVEYWYCLVAYDAGDSTVPIGSLQNGFGRPESDINVVKVMPRSDPAGFYDAFSTVEHMTRSGGPISDGMIYPIIFDRGAVIGDEYRVYFTEDDFETYWHLIRVDSLDVNNIDTTWLLQDQTRNSGDPNLYAVAEGVRLVVRNDGVRMPRSMAQTGFATTGDTTLHMTMVGTLYDTWPSYFSEADLGGDKHFRATYEVRFTSGGSQGYLWWDDVTPINLPFEIWNTTFGYQVIAEIIDQDGDLIWEPDEPDYIVIVDIPYDGNPHPEGYPFYHTWVFRFGTQDLDYAAGDVFTIGGAPVNSADDIFIFKTDGINASAAGRELKDIKVFPDPYLGRATILESSKYYRRLHFINLPDICTVRIYTLGGDLVKTIDHEGAGTAEWDLLSSDGLQVASGVYIYHVESEYGSHVGRFAVIL